MMPSKDSPLGINQFQPKLSWPQLSNKLLKEVVNWEPFVTNFSSKLMPKQEVLHGAWMICHSAVNPIWYVELMSIIKPKWAENLCLPLSPLMTKIYASIGVHLSFMKKARKLEPIFSQLWNKLWRISKKLTMEWRPKTSLFTEMEFLDNNRKVSPM